MRFTGTLLEHQAEHFHPLLLARYAIIAHDMGLGKSILSLALACHVGQPTLIVCPAYLRKKWHDEDVGEFTENGNFKIVSYGDLVKNADTIGKYNFIIADEAHYLKNMQSNRTKAFHSYIIKNAPEHLYLLSGTPIKNRVPEIFSLLQLCYYGGKYPQFSNFYRLYYKFCSTFCNQHRFTVRGREVTQYVGLKNVELLKKVIKPIYFRRKLGEGALPPQTRIPITIKAKSDYDNKLMKAFEKFDVDPDDSSYMTLKAANALAKTPATVELAKNIIEEGNRVVIFTDHVAACEEIASFLNVTAITGAMKPELRSVYVDRFKKDLNKALVATIGSLSTGQNLQCANYMIFNDFSYVPSDLEQAEKRIHRIGQDKPCMYYYIFTSPIDKKIYSAVRSKMKTIKEVNND